jgi:hypothetical protein
MAGAPNIKNELWNEQIDADRKERQTVPPENH